MINDRYLAQGVAPGIRDLCIIKCVGLVGDDADRLRAAFPERIEFSTCESELTSTVTSESFGFEEFIHRTMDHKTGVKHGSCWSPFIFEKEERGKSNATAAYVAVLDCDRGDSAADIIAACTKVGSAAIIVSSYSNGARRMEVRLAEYERWQSTADKPTAEEFLLSRGYHTGVATGAQLLLADDGRPKIKRRKNGEYYVIRHRPCPKYRVVLFPAQPCPATFGTGPGATRRTGPPSV